MVFANGFVVKVQTTFDHEKFMREGYNYVALQNNTEYKLYLGNERNTECMAEVYLEGELIGTWFIPANDSILIERPADVERKFVFVSEKSYQASSAGVVVGELTNGLVRVKFYPKKYMPVMRVAQASFAPASRSFSGAQESLMTSKSYSSGATVLGESSSQRFGTRRRFRDDEIDSTNITEISIRLVVQEQRYIPSYTSIAQRNQMPPRIEDTNGYRY